MLSVNKSTPGINNIIESSSTIAWEEEEVEAVVRDEALKNRAVRTSLKICLPSSESAYGN